MKLKKFEWHSISQKSSGDRQGDCLLKIERKTKQFKKDKVNKDSNMAVCSIYQENLEKTICMAIAMYYPRFLSLSSNIWELKFSTL